MTEQVQFAYHEDHVDRVERTHIVPLNDLREHEITVHCWCGPTECDDEPSIMLHHAADGRESYEDGTRRPH